MVLGKHGRHRASRSAGYRQDWCVQADIISFDVSLTCSSYRIEVDAVFGEILTACSKIDYLLKYGESALAPETRPTNLLLAHKVSKVYSHPNPESNSSS